MSITDTKQHGIIIIKLHNMRYFKTQVCLLTMM